MANLTGWVHLHKSIRRNRIWKREPFTYGQAFCDLLLLAVDGPSAPQTIWLQGEQIVLERGQVGWSIVKLAEEWHRSRPWVMAFLKWSQDQGMLVVDSNHRRTIITVVNYDAYQTDLTTGLTTGVTTDLTTGLTTGVTTDLTTGLTTELTHKGKGERGKGKEGKGKGETPPLPEIPDDEALARHFAEFADLARGIAGIPEVWWRGWVSSRLNAQRWPSDWRGAARQAFLADWIARHPKALAGTAGKNKKNAAGPAASPDGRTPAQARFELSRELEGMRERLDACHDTNVEPAAADVRREKEIENLLKELTQ